ncbi:MAG TPA: pitrilysin family protein [Candidatus Eremiobacteraceae bacterium]|nr:pitrilysin family protein [Candidatus Eremiobacteraceae bacterium]
MRTTITAVAVLAAALFIAATPPPPVVASVTRATLPNGLRVVIVRDPLAPVVSTEMNYLVGSAEAPAGFPGMAHAQEHMMFRSSAGLSTFQLADISAIMGGDMNADTQDTATQYLYTVPADDLDTVLHIESIRMRGVLDAESEWAQERGAIEQEVSRDLSDPLYKFLSAARLNMFAGTPYEHDALGTRPSFDKTTGVMLKSFYNTWYQPNNAILVIAGDVDPTSALAKVRQYFNGIPSHVLPARKSVRLRPLKAARMTLDSDLFIPLALVAYRYPGFNDADYGAAQVLAHALASQRGALYELGVTGSAYFAGFETGPALPQTGSAFVFGAINGNGSLDAFARRLQAVIDDYVKNGVPDDLVDASKRQLIAQAEFNKNSIGGLAQAWSQALAVQGASSPDDEVAAFAKVTKADVDRVARRYLVNTTATVGLLRPRHSGHPAAGKGFGGSESFAPKQTAPVELPDWGKALIANVSVPHSNVVPTVTALRNGIRLIVVRDTVSPTVTVLGRVKSNPDLETPPGKEGVESVLDDLLSYGTQSLDRVSFQRQLDDIAASENAGTDFSLSVPSANFDRGIQLLADNELHPALPQRNFTIVQQQAAFALGGRLTSPSYLADRALNAALFPKDDPTQRQATPATVNQLTLADVKEYYSRVFRPDLTTMVVIGDVTPQQAATSVTKWFGDWKVSGPQPPTQLAAVPPNVPSAVNVPNAQRAQDEVTLAQTIGLTRSDPDYYPLEVGSHVLGGGFYATRLYKDVRAEAGLAYEVSDRLDVGKTRATYQVSFGSDPQSVNKVRTIILRDVTSMQAAPVTQNELQIAKALLLREITLRESSEESIAHGLLSRSVDDVPLDEPQIAAARYAATTAEQVQAAFANWIRPASFVQVTQGPAPR